jgi:hypothetical protein
LPRGIISKLNLQYWRVRPGQHLFSASKHSTLPTLNVNLHDFSLRTDPTQTSSTRAWIASNFGRYELAEFYPSTPGVEESGSRRGCVLLAHGAQQEFAAIAQK